LALCRFAEVLLLAVAKLENFRGPLIMREMFEHRSKPLLPRRQFYGRVARCLRIGMAIIAVSLGIGMSGYHVFEHLSWLDAFANASMILSGMGPLNPLETTAGKIFASCYALFSGVAFLSSIAVVFAPIFHRFLHKFHLEQNAKAEDKKSK
jgi:hypothetical protein